MSSPEQNRPTPQEAAKQVYTTFALLRQRGHAAAEGKLITVPNPDTQGQKMLAAIRPLIELSQASPYYKRKIDGEMYDEKGIHRGGSGYLDAGMYFSIWDAEDPGIFDKPTAAAFETIEMLNGAKALVEQAKLNPDIFTGAMNAARKGKEDLRKWARSFDVHFGRPVLNYLEEALKYADLESKPCLETDVNRLRSLLTYYTEEEI